MENVKTESLGHLMIDLETLGSESNSVIASIGAVEFDMNTGQTGRTFYKTIDIDSCLNAGLKVNGGTIRWWLEQSAEARAALTKGGENINIVLYHFANFIKTLDPKTLQIWSRGQRFDIGLLEDAFNALQLTIPWNFRGERDVRTLEGLRPELYKEAVRTNVAHNPIDDCLFQIEYCTKIWQNINGVPSYV